MQWIAVVLNSAVLIIYISNVTLAFCAFVWCTRGIIMKIKYPALFWATLYLIVKPGFQQDSPESGRTSSESTSSSLSSSSPRCAVNCRNAGSCFGTFCFCLPGYHGQFCQHRTVYNSVFLFVASRSIQKIRNGGLKFDFKIGLHNLLAGLIAVIVKSRLMLFSSIFSPIVVC